jgi:ribulose-phosphate 3-epimerase
MRKKLVAPSILSANFANLEKEISEITRCGADWVHVDVMDGHFVDNITLGAPVVKSLRPITKLLLDVHLMIERPEKYIDDFIKAGSDYITLHVESTSMMDECLKKIKGAGVKAGITLKPRTPLESILPFLPMVDLVLIMTVEPGFGGQSFMMDQVEKMKFLRKLIDEKYPQVLIEVDGGVNAETAAYCRDAHVLVAGNYIFKNHKDDYSIAINKLKQ